MTSAADTLFPQIYGGSDKKKVGLILQKGIFKILKHQYIFNSL